MALSSRTRNWVAACRGRDAWRRARGRSGRLCRRSARSERDRLVLPGRIERVEIGRVRIGRLQQHRHFVRLRLARRQARPAPGTPPRRANAACAGVRPAPRGYAPAGSSASQASGSGRVARYSRNSGRKSGSSAAVMARPAFSYCAFRSIMAWPRSRLSPCTCSNRCSDSERVRSNSRT